MAKGGFRGGYGGMGGMSQANMMKQAQKMQQELARMQAELEEIYANIWEESRALYGDEIIDILLSGEYKTLSEAAE